MVGVGAWVRSNSGVSPVASGAAVFRAGVGAWFLVLGWRLGFWRWVRVVSTVGIGGS